MDPKAVMKALEALIAGDDEGCAEILKGLIASAAGGQPDADGEGDPAATTDDPNAQVSSEVPPGDGKPAEDDRDPTEDPGADAEDPKAPHKPSKASVATDIAGLATLPQDTGADAMLILLDLDQLLSDSELSALESAGA